MTDKSLIKVRVVLGVVLSLFVFMLFVNEVKESKYIGRGTQVGNTISVTADGEVMAVPDIAMITLTISKDGKTAKEAQNLVNDLTTQTVALLKKENILDKDIKSEYGGVNPKYDYGQVVCITYPCPTKVPTIVGYTATQSISIKVRDADNANNIKTGLATLGIDNISGPTFSIDDEDILKDQARNKAIAKAKEKAEVLAEELDVDLGDVVSFSENSSGYPMMYAKMDMAVSSMGAPERAPTLPKGENKITSSVTITYEIK